jgi:hypothetical protein
MVWMVNAMFLPLYPLKENSAPSAGKCCRSRVSKLRLSRHKIKQPNKQKNCFALLFMPDPGVIWGDDSENVIG